MIELLPPVAERLTRYCVWCGHPFECYADSIRATCSPRCTTKRWRSVGMLAGTVVYVDGQYRAVQK